MSEKPRLRSQGWQSRYSSGRDDLLAHFYTPALSNSARLCRAVGFFRSTFYTLVARSAAAFALNGGKIYLICSPDLVAGDLHALRAGVKPATVVVEAARRELEAIVAQTGGSSGPELLSALIGFGTLQIRFALATGTGIFHDKVGVFEDVSGDSMSFSGSANETWNAWHAFGNHESFEVFTSWSPDAARVSEHKRYLDRLWHGLEPGVTLFTAQEAIGRALVTVSRDDHRSVLERAARTDSQPTAAKTLFPHQADAVAAWYRAGQRGILKHATGSGKTITALEIVRRHLQGRRPAMVVVPSVLLLEQWTSEAKLALADVDPAVLLVGGGNDRWRKNGLLRAFTEPGDEARLVVATLQTAASDAFLAAAVGGEHLLLCADEVHRCGSGEYRRLLDLHAGATLGLSATPERYRDPDGTSVIFEYFGPVVPPVVTLQDAVRAGRLCPYEYHVHPVDLSADEEAQWKELTRRLSPLLPHRSGQPLSQAAQLLLIRRARVAKGAREKATVAARIVEREFERGQHWLLYCDDRTQVASVRQALSEASVESFEYWSDMRGDRLATMERFQREGGVIVAIRCLDEGVDVPMLSHGVVLASSQNPREFIQRRGRLLRRAPGKDRAVVHDLLVAPPPDSERHFRSLTLAELARAHVFALDAVNTGAALALQGLAIDWDVDLEAIDTDDGFEEESTPDEQDGAVRA